MRSVYIVLTSARTFSVRSTCHSLEPLSMLPAASKPADAALDVRRPSPQGSVDGGAASRLRCTRPRCRCNSFSRCSRCLRSARFSGAPPRRAVNAIESARRSSRRDRVGEAELSTRAPVRDALEPRLAPFDSSSGHGISLLHHTVQSAPHVLSLWYSPRRFRSPFRFGFRPHAAQLHLHIRVSARTRNRAQEGASASGEKGWTLRSRARACLRSNGGPIHLTVYSGGTSTPRQNHRVYT